MKLFVVLTVFIFALYIVGNEAQTQTTQQCKDQVMPRLVRKAQSCQRKNLRRLPVIFASYAMTMDDAVSLVIVVFALAGSGSPCHLCIYANDLRQHTAVRL